MAKSKNEAEGRAIFEEMEDKDVTPDEITLTTATKKCQSFERALALIDFCLSKKNFVGRGTFQAAYSYPIAHLSAKELLIEYHNREYKFETALEGPINQYRRTGQADQALLLITIAPHVGAAEKFYREEYFLCRSFFEAEILAGNDEDNLYYGFGIAAALNGDWKNAVLNLEIARDRSYADKRTIHINSLLSEAS